MADTSPTPLVHGAKSANSFAFCCLNGRQQGHVFPLSAAKVMLQFDSLRADGTSQPTRCLVIQGPNGVAVRTIEGEVTVNNVPQSDIWMEVGDEVTCGDSHLRLIRQPSSEASSDTPATFAATPPNGLAGNSRQIPRGGAGSSMESMAELSPAGNTDWYSPASAGSIAEMQNQLPPDIPCAPNFADGMDAVHGPDLANYFADQSAPMGGTAGFFSRLTPDEAASEPPMGSATMCVNPEELRALLQPTIYGDDDSSSNTPAAPPAPIAEDVPPFAPTSAPTQKSPFPTEFANPSSFGKPDEKPTDSQIPEAEDSIQLVERQFNALDSIVASDVGEPRMNQGDLLPINTNTLLEAKPAPQPVAHIERTPAPVSLESVAVALTPNVESSETTNEKTIEPSPRNSFPMAPSFDRTFSIVEEPTNRRRLTSDVIEVSCVEPYVLVVRSSEWSCLQGASTIDPLRFNAQNVQGVILHW